MRVQPRPCEPRRTGEHAASSRNPPSTLAAVTGSIVAGCAAARPPRRVVPQRRHLAHSPQGIGRHARFALPGMRCADLAPRQRPGAVVARAARPLPPLRDAHLGALPVDRARVRGAVRRARRALRATRGRCPRYLVFGAALLAISVIDLEHYIIPNRIVYPARVRVGAAARARRRARRRVVAVRARAHRRGRARSARCS